ncbi:DUF21-domain-containing protein [Sistotremastrum suecicum HHB10207 ss-3]|uniref:DUF21-domain-containing protein n=1 Tax=Sistotremastrum suecicum HHB10207 ss-3 TaxID=1314776 RepID=A0A165YD61_9AGAM|nr:DUF21-domain-containing protein [Sistotremastrum suecicum HHB10207 ss-3]
MIVPHFFQNLDETTVNHLIKRAEGSKALNVVLALLIPVLVILSGVFAGLTLGYMSLDETQLNVLSMSGSPEQKKYAAKILPIRKNGHLLLVSLLLANMIVNETLPVISDRVLGGGVQAVVISTVLIVIFAEIIPQSICTRYGLYVGAKMVIPTRILIYALWIIAFPVAKLLEFILGPHHGIIYRRAELKELIAMHAVDHPQSHGGELKHDTAAIIGHTLDLQEKVVQDAMSPINRVFMLSRDAVLDYATLTEIHKTGHSRIPVFEEISIPVPGKPLKTEKTKKIIGILLVKQCVLLDPEDATPVSSIPLNAVPSIPFDEPLLKVLDRFQEGRSHMAIVSRYSQKRAASVKEAAKPAMTRRFLNRVGLGDSDSSSDDEGDAELGNAHPHSKGNGEKKKEKKERKECVSMNVSLGGKEQSMPADALMAKADAENFLSKIDTHVNPMGIITLEDVLEELIGEEIYDEFDLRGANALPASSYVPPEAERAVSAPQVHPASAPNASNANFPSIASVGAGAKNSMTASTPALTGATKAKASALRVPKVSVPNLGLGGLGLGGILRTRSAPGTPRGGHVALAPDNSLPPGVGASGAGSGELDEKKTTVETSGLGFIKESGTPSPTGDEHEMVQTPDNGTSTSATLSVAPASGLVGYGEKDDSPVVRLPAPTPAGQPQPPPTFHPSMPLPVVHPAPVAPHTITIPRASSPTPSLLTEVVLRGRQARMSSGASTPVPGAPGPGLGVDGIPAAGRAIVKGRFKSSPLSPLDGGRTQASIERGGRAREVVQASQVTTPPQSVTPTAQVATPDAIADNEEVGKSMGTTTDGMGQKGMEDQNAMG